MHVYKLCTCLYTNIPLHVYTHSLAYVDTFCSMYTNYARVCRHAIHCTSTNIHSNLYTHFLARLQIMHVFVDTQSNARLHTLTRIRRHTMKHVYKFCMSLYTRNLFARLHTLTRIRKHAMQHVYKLCMSLYTRIQSHVYTHSQEFVDTLCSTYTNYA